MIQEEVQKALADDVWLVWGPGPCPETNRGLPKQLLKIVGESSTIAIGEDPISTWEIITGGSRGWCHRRARVRKYRESGATLSDEFCIATAQDFLELEP